MKKFVFIIQLFIAFSAFAQARQFIWPEGAMPYFQAHQLAKMTSEEGNNKYPYLEWCEKPSAPNGVCMILISGGGYKSCCDVRLVKIFADKFTKAGFQCVNLVYRTPRPKGGLEFYKSAWADGQRAVRLVRSQAANRGFDPEKIGTISMSAGSHLATLLATSSQSAAYEKIDTLDDVSCHINFAITGAIAYALTDGLGTPNSRDGYWAKLDSVFKFDEKTAPMCMFHGSADIYSPLASTRVYRQLRKRKVPAELHLFADRGHGFWGDLEKIENVASYDRWFDRALEFLTQLGFLGKVKPEEELDKRYAVDYHDKSKYSKENLWPKGKIPDFQKKQNIPYLEWYIPSNLTTKAIQIIYSGGSYMSNSPEWFEVAPMRRFLNEKGMAVVTMMYRAPRPAAPLAKHLTAWQDLQRCIRLVRSQAQSKGLDPKRIGIMGSSAGGHLTLMGVTSSRSKSYLSVDKVDKVSCKVQWGVGIYPAYALSDGLEAYNKTGGNDDSAVLAQEFVFDADTAPMVLIHGDIDGWAAMNSVKVWEKMKAMGIGSDLHTLCLRNHCFQRKASPGTGSYTWMERIWEFLNHKNFNK